MRSIQKAVILSFGLWLGVLAILLSPKEKPELNGIAINGANLNGISLQGTELQGIELQGIELQGVVLNGLRVNGLHVNGQSPAVSSEITQSTTTAILNNQPIQAISLDRGQLVLHMD